MGRYYFLCTTLMIALVGLADCFQGSIAIAGDTVLGGSVAVTCSWITAANENMMVLTISQFETVTGNNYIYQISPLSGNPPLWVAPGTPTPESRFSVDNGTFANQNITMRISALQCTDERNYSCIFKIGIAGVSNQDRSETKQVVIKARPKSPDLRVTPANTTDVMEQSTVSAVCNANLGRPGRGSMEWKIYRNGNVETIPDSDSRVTKKDVALQAGEANCTLRQEQTLQMQVSRSDQNLAIACFVKNVDFPLDQTTDVCQDSAAQFCRKTETFKIYYGVTNSSNGSMTVSREPPGNIYQGMKVYLLCQATGYPSPNYTWIKVGDENQTLSSVMVGDKSQLTLPSVVDEGGNSQIYRCTASNAPLGKPFAASRETDFVILITTTTTTTTITTTPTTSVTTNTGPTGGGTEAQDGNKSDSTNTIIIVVVVVGSVLIIAIIIGVVCWKKRSKKEIEEPSEKPYNNRTNLSFQNPHQQQPDLVADKKFQNPTVDNINNKTSLNSSSPSFNEKNEDGLMYADLTYDNKPRSRKPIAINDSSSDYSDIQMPQV